MKRRNMVIGFAVLTLGGSVAVVQTTNVSSGSGSGLVQAPPTQQELDLAAQLEQHVRDLALHVGRRNTSRNGTLKEAVEWLTWNIESLGYQPKLDEWSIDGQPCVNFEITFPGTGLPGETVVIGTHYDSYRNSPCAEASGTGTAALLVLLERLKGYTFERTTKFVFFTNGELPHRGTDDSGAVRYAKRAKESGEKIVAMVCVGPFGYFTAEEGSQGFIFPWNLAWPGTGDFVAIFGDPRSRDLVKKAANAWKQSSTLPLVAGAVPSWLPGMQVSDHDAFQAQGFPAVLVSDTGGARFEDIRSVYDQFNRMSYAPMARAVLHLEKFVKALAP